MMENHGAPGEIKNGMPPVHPGELLVEELKYLKISPKRFSKLLAVPQRQVEAILSCERDVDAEFALRLERYFGSGSQMWMNLQVDFSLKVARRDFGERIEREVEPRVEESSEVVEAA